MTRDEMASVPGTVLEAFGFGEADVRRLDGGQVNASWAVRQADRELVIRRSHISRGASAVEWEQALVRFAGTGGWPVANPRAATAGRPVVLFGGRVWSASEFRGGEHPPQDSVAMQHIYGRLLARLHDDLAAFPLEGQRPGAGKLWELDTWVAPASSGSFNELLAQFGREHDELAALIRRYRYRNLRELARLRYPDLPDRPIHGDFDASNLLWKDGKLAAVLDFDWCRRDALACDLAAALPWDQMTGDRIRALIEGYEEVRPLDDTEWALLPALTRAHLLFFIAFRLVEWKLLGGERPTHSIGRTVRDRLPRTEGLERYLATLRTAGGVR